VEVFAITVLSVFAFIGLMSVRSYLFGLVKTKYTDKGLKFILCLPENIGPKLEGIVRQIFMEEIPERLMSDGKLYIIPAMDDEESKKLLESLKSQYPLEMLPDTVSYCMIQERENS